MTTIATTLKNGSPSSKMAGPPGSEPESITLEATVYRSVLRTDKDTGPSAIQKRSECVPVLVRPKINVLPDIL